jgi:mannosyltransferase
VQRLERALVLLTLAALLLFVIGVAIMRHLSRVPPLVMGVFASRQGRIVQRLELALVPLSLAALLLFVILGIDRSVWLDEAYSIFVSSHNFAGIAEQLRNDNNLPAYYYLLAIWMRVVGDSEVATRALSGFFYICSTVATFLLGLSLFRDRRTALYGAFFFLVSTQAIRQAQNVRTYSFLSFLTALSTLTFLRLFYDGSRERWAWGLCIAVNAIGLLTHVWFVFVLVAQAAALVLCLPRTTWKKYLLATGVSSLPFLGLWLPFFREQVHNGSTAWMPLFQSWFVPDALLGFYGGVPLGLMFYGTCAALVLLGDRQGLRRFISGGAAGILLTLFVVSLATPLIVSVVTPIYWPGRYTIIGLPPLAVLLGSAVAWSAPRPWLVLVCYIVLLTSAVAHISWNSLPAGQSDKATTQYIVQHAEPGDVIIFTSLSRLAVDYYLHRFHAGGRFVEITFPDEIRTHPGWRDTRAMLQRRDSIALEAAQVMTTLEDFTRGGERRVWLLYGIDRPVSDILKEQLDRHSILHEQKDLGGSFYDRVLIYHSP